MMHAGTPPAESGSGGPNVLIRHVPAPLQVLSSVHERLGSPEQNEPTLPKKSHSKSDTPSQLERSPLIVDPVCTWKLCAMPVHPVSRSAPGTTVSVRLPRGGQVQSIRHFPGQSASSVPSHSSPACSSLSPHVAAAQVQFAWHWPGHALSSLPSHCSLA